MNRTRKNMQIGVVALSTVLYATTAGPAQDSKLPPKLPRESSGAAAAVDALETGMTAIEERIGTIELRLANVEERAESAGPDGPNEGGNFLETLLLLRQFLDGADTGMIEDAWAPEAQSETPPEAPEITEHPEETGGPDLSELGQLRVHASADVAWKIFEVGGDTALHEASGTADVALPPGFYDVEIFWQRETVVIRKGELTEFQ